MVKRARQKKILELVSTQRVQNQAQLQALLQSEGLAVTQSTLSRDIKELNLVKGSEGYRTPGGVQMLSTGRGALAQALVRYLVKAVAAQNILVLKTAPGDAHPLAIALDHSEMASILGTVAGDDTILIVTSDREAASSLCRDLTEMARGS